MQAFGIAYKATCILSGKGYVGVTKKTADQRWRGHINSLNKTNGKAQCPLIVKAIRKYGADCWVIETLASAETEENLLSLEILLIKQEDTLAPNGYNLSPGGRGNFNGLVSPEGRAKAIAKHRGMKHPPGTGTKIRERLLGQKRTPEQIAKRKGIKYKPRSKDAKQNTSIAIKKHWNEKRKFMAPPAPRSEESRKKSSEALKLFNQQLREESGGPVKRSPHKSETIEKIRVKAIERMNDPTRKTPPPSPETMHRVASQGWEKQRREMENLIQILQQILHSHLCLQISLGRHTYISIKNLFIL